MSWWIGVSRQDWPAKVEAEQARMELSRFGRMQWLDGGTPSHVSRPNAKQRARFGEEWE